VNGTVPAHKPKTGSPSRRNTTDSTICPISTFSAAAANAAVRAESLSGATWI